MRVQAIDTSLPLPLPHCPLQVMASHYERVQQLQRLFFKHVPKLQELALANCGTGAPGGGQILGGAWRLDARQLSKHHQRAAAPLMPAMLALSPLVAFYIPCCITHPPPPPPPATAVAKREVLRKELSALTPDELRFLVTRQLRCVTVRR